MTRGTGNGVVRNGAVKNSGDKVVLARNVGLPGCIGMVMGIVIGTGIFISPKGVLAGAGGSVGWSLILWVVCAVISTIGALCYVELSTTFGKSGGEFTFILETFGPFLAFLRMWTYLAIIMPAILAVQGLTIANYVTTPFFSQCEQIPNDGIRLLAATVLFILVYINCVSVKWSTRLLNVLTVAKTVGLVVVILSGIVFLCKGYTGNLQNAFEVPQKTNIPLAIYSGIFAYSGWESVNTIVEEIKRPERNIPLSVIISMFAITCLYLLANVAYFTILTPMEILSSNAVAADFSTRALGYWSWTIWVFVALSAIGNMNGNLFAFSRIFFATAREGLLPGILGMINIKHRTPLPAVVIALPLAIICLMVDDVIALIQYSVFVAIAFMALTVCVIPYDRWKNPQRIRPFRLPVLVPILFTIAVLFIMGMTIYTDPVSSCIGLGLTLVGVPLYLIFVKWNKPAHVAAKLAKFTIALQKIFYAVPQEVGENEAE